MNGESLSTNQYHVVYPRINDPIYQKDVGYQFDLYRYWYTIIG
jgi:hypothetical protein